MGNITLTLEFVSHCFSVSPFSSDNLSAVAATCGFGDALRMSGITDRVQLRVRYSETDQMGTFYNSRALEWFEFARSELMRNKMGISYMLMEERGAFLPVVEAHLEFQGRARFDDLLEVLSEVDWQGRASLRFNVAITQTETRRPVVRGYTIHAFTDRQGRPIRPPAWFVELFAKDNGSDSYNARSC
jgi:acyl-CoA thioester hydrolase